MGVGAMTDFGPLLANPKTLLLGAAAQFGIFATVLGALALNYFGIIEFTLPQAALSALSVVQTVRPRFILPVNSRLNCLARLP